MAEQPPTPGFTQEQFDKLTAFLKAKRKNEACHACGTSAWHIYGPHYLTISPGNGPVMLTGQAVVVAALTCGNCGNTEFVNVITAGVLKGE